MCILHWMNVYYYYYYNYIFLKQIKKEGQERPANNLA